MTSVNSSIISALSGATSGSTSASSSSTSDAESVQTTFLTLLTTQLKNQDPLDPVNSAETTSQLAQIATVEGVSTLNQTLSTLMSNLESTDAIGAANLVGHSVLVEGKDISLSSGSAVGGVELDSAADSVVVTIKNSSGQTVQTVDLGALPAGTNTFTWDGTDSDGNTVSDGTYYISVAASSNGTSVSASTLQLGTVNSVSNTSDGVDVNVSGVGSVSVSDILLIL